MPNTEAQKLIFFWIPKTAGSSIYKVLEKSGCQKLLFYKNYSKFNNKGMVTFSHVGVNYLLKKNILTPEYYNQSRKFCVVRNPWDRMVSLYFYTKMDQRMTFEEFVHLVHKKMKLKNHPFFRNFFPIGKKLLPTLFYKAALRISPRFTHFLPLPDVGRFNVVELSQCNEQSAWIENEQGEIVVDTICRFENLSEDFKELCNQLGIDETLPHDNRTEHKNYRFYYSEELKQMVATIYKKDIERFNYTF